MLGHEYDNAAQALSIRMPFIPIELRSLLNSPRFSPLTEEKSTKKQTETRFVVLAKSIMFQIISGVSYLHAQNVAHRDLKPGNIMLTDDGCVKLLDFGVSWTRNENPADMAGDVWPEYQERMYCEVSSG